MLSLLLGLALSAGQTTVRLCIYDTSTSLCPSDSTAHFSIHHWDEYRAHEQEGFGATDSVAVTYYLLVDLNPSVPVELHLPSLGVHNVTFRPVGAERRFVYLEGSSTTNARYFRFYNCLISIYAEDALYFYDLFLQNSIFFSATSRLWAYNTLEVDLFSAAVLPSLTSEKVTLNFEKSFWPLGTQIVRLSRLLTIRNFTIKGIDHQLVLRIFGDMLVFQRPGHDAAVYVDIQEVISRPLVILDHDDGQLTVYCDYFVPKFYDPPVLEFRLVKHEPLIFGDSAWPVWIPNLLLVTTEGRGGQTFWTRTRSLPVTVKTYWNVSETYEPIGDPKAPGEWLSELTIRTDVEDAVILGQVQTQASDLHFDTGIHDRPVTLTLLDFLEFGMELAEDPSHLLDKGVFPHIQQPNLHVRFGLHEKHETLNTSSKFGGSGTWEWVNFPYGQGATGVGNLFLVSGLQYDVYYGHTWTGSFGSALCELNPETDGESSVQFSIPTQPSVFIRPNYYFNEFNRPTNDFLEHNWPVAKDVAHRSAWPALLYFGSARIPDDAGIEIVEPEYGAPGFEQSTFFFDFVWDGETKAYRMIRKVNKTVADFNYRFCYNPQHRTSSCPPDYAVITDVNDIPRYVKPNAKQLRFALAGDLTYDFSYFTNHQIDIRVFIYNSTGLRQPFNFTVPPSFLSGSKFGIIHLHNITFRFTQTVTGTIEINETSHLDLHNVTFDRSVINSLRQNGCQDTGFIEADPISYLQIHDHCLPDVLYLDEGLYERIDFTQDTLTLLTETRQPLVISSRGGRPADIEIYYHANHLELNCGTGVTRIPRTHIWMPNLLGAPNYTFGGGWTNWTAGNLTIDNLYGRFYISTPFVPFRPGGVARGREFGNLGIRILPATSADYPNGVRVYYPFPTYIHVNYDPAAVVLRFEDAELFTPMSPAGGIERAIFAGGIHFDETAGINIDHLSFDHANPPSIIVEFRLQGGLPRLYFGTVDAPTDLPKSFKLLHRGSSERAFIARHPDWFREFSHELICAGAAFPCEHWQVTFDRNSTEDPTNDHYGGTSVLRTNCRQQRQGLQEMCLVLEIDEYYFPLATFSPFPSPRPWPTALPHASSPHTSPGGANQGEYNANSGVGKGVGIGLAVGVVLIGVAGFIAYKFFGPSSRADYQVADLP